MQGIDPEVYHHLQKTPIRTAMRSQCVTLGKGLSPACDNLLHLRCFQAPESAYSREEQKDTGMEPLLLIDDDVELCSMLSDYLGRHGYEVTAVHNGKTGLAKALASSYSIVLLDVMLPGLDGFEVLRRLRAAALFFLRRTLGFS